jgi:hypothetical protein
MIIFFKNNKVTHAHICRFEFWLFVKKKFWGVRGVRRGRVIPLLKNKN